MGFVPPEHNEQKDGEVRDRADNMGRRPVYDLLLFLSGVAAVPAEKVRPGKTGAVSQYRMRKSLFFMNPRKIAKETGHGLSEELIMLRDTVRGLRRARLRSMQMRGMRSAIFGSSG